MTTKYNPNYSAPHGKYNASMMTGKTAASTTYQDELSYAGRSVNVNTSPSKSGSPKKGRQGNLRPSASGSPTKNKRLQMAQNTQKSIKQGSMNDFDQTNNMFYNAGLMEKINAKQDEFDQLFAEYKQRRPDSPLKGERKGSPSKVFKGQVTTSNLNDVVDVMKFIYGGERPAKHKSPTKRLMQQKEAAWTHKTHLKNNLASTDAYSLTYVCDPKKTYVIQPKEGEINYEMADKKPLKFYDTVMKQKVTEHKVQRAKTFVGSPDKDNNLPKRKVLKKGKSLELKSRITIRAVCRILRAVQNKMERLLEDHCDEGVTPDDLRRAMSHPET